MAVTLDYEQIMKDHNIVFAPDWFLHYYGFAKTIKEKKYLGACMGPFPYIHKKKYVWLKNKESTHTLLHEILHVLLEHHKTYIDLKNVIRNELMVCVTQKEFCEVYEIFYEGLRTKEFISWYKDQLGRDLNLKEREIMERAKEILKGYLIGVKTHDKAA